MTLMVAAAKGIYEVNYYVILHQHKQLIMNQFNTTTYQKIKQNKITLR